MYTKPLVACILLCIAGKVLAKDKSHHGLQKQEKTTSLNITKKNEDFPYRISYALLNGTYSWHYAEIQTRNRTHNLHFEYIDRSKPTILVVPGFTLLHFFDNLIENFWESFTSEGFNVIVVNWDFGSAYVKRSNKISHLLNIGRQVGKAIRDLYQEEIFLERIVAHKVGIIVGGKALRSLPRFTVNRFVALDPKRYLLQIPSKHRVTKRSVLLLEAVHTSVGKDGIRNAIGHRDFYPNGGRASVKDCDLSPRFGQHCPSVLAFLYYTDFMGSGSGDYRSYLCYSWIAFVKGKCKRNPSMFLRNHFAVTDRPLGKYYLYT